MKQPGIFFTNLTIKKTGFFAICGCLIILYQTCTNSENRNNKISAKETAAPANIPFTNKVPADIVNPADSMQAAEFAWKEFVALIWPAKVNPSPGPGLSQYFRGQPSQSEKPGSTGAGGVVVWETFYHRDELYPGYATGAGNVLPNPDTIPSYIYQTPIIKATPTTNLNLFNNLDEASEISLAYMYYTPLAQKADSLKKSMKGKLTAAQKLLLADANIKASLMYEAKGNGVIYNYLKVNSFNNSVPRRKARAQSINQISNLPVKGAVFQFPAGALEVKATWRHYDALKDNLNQFHWTLGIYYTNNTSGSLVAHNDTLLLVGLHIIQKTPNVPTFTFATFEHVTNETNGFRFTNTDPLTDTMGLANGLIPRPLPDSGTITAQRRYPVPAYLKDYNKVVQKQLRQQFGNDIVWANYQLIGVQAVVQDDPGGPVPDQQFFLSNFATETNNSLQFFQGGLAGPNSNVPDPDLGHVFVFDSTQIKFIGHTSGGCLGCHGSQGQFQGGDFSVIAATGNTFSPEAITPYPGGKVIPQNFKGFPLPHK